MDTRRRRAVAALAALYLGSCAKQVVIGSTSDPKFMQLNPYGLSVAPSTIGRSPSRHRLTGHEDLLQR